MRGFRKTSWWLPVRLPINDIAEFLSETNEKRARGRYLEIEININLKITPPDKESGIMTQTVEFNGDWSVPNIGNYPGYINEAIDKYLASIDVPEKFSDKLNSFVDSYYQAIKYPNL